MKKRIDVWSFTTVKLQAKRLCLLAAFTAVIVFTLTAATCGGSKPYVSKTDDSATYTLSVMDSKGKVSANPQEGDAYVLKIEYPNKDVLTGSGTVAKVNVSSGELVLTPHGGSQTLNVKINSGGSMTGIKGNFSLPGGAALALSLSEGDLTAITDGAPPADPETDSKGGIGGFFSNLFGGGNRSSGANLSGTTWVLTDAKGPNAMTIGEGEIKFTSSSDLTLWVNMLGIEMEFTGTYIKSGNTINTIIAGYEDNGTFSISGNKMKDSNGNTFTKGAASPRKAKAANDSKSGGGGLSGLFGGLFGGGGNSKSGGDLPGYIGNTLKLSGQVVEFYGLGFQNFTGSKTLREDSHYKGEKGGITKGTFNFSIGVPTDLFDIEWDFMHDFITNDGEWQNVTTTPATGVQSYALKWFHFDDGYSIHREDMSGNFFNLSGSKVDVNYIYVDRDVTIKGDSGTLTNIVGTVTYNAFTISLKKGWNRVYRRETYSRNGSSISGVIEVGTGEPGGMKWLLEDY